MSSSKKYVYQGLPGFDIDPETGKYFPVPVDFKAVFGDKTEKPTPRWKWNNSKTTNESHSVQPVKNSKVETGVAKELFKVPRANWRPLGDANKETRPRTCCTGVRQSLAETLPSSYDSNKISKLKVEKNSIPSLKLNEQQPEMNSSKKYVYQGLPGFDIDPETGKYFPVSVDFKAVFGDKTEKPTPRWKWRNSKTSNESHSIQPVKYRKVETGVRKELFKVSRTNWGPAIDGNKETRSRTFCTGVRRSLAKTLPSSNDSNEISKLKVEKNGISSLKSIEEREVNQSNSDEENGQLLIVQSTPKAKSPIKKDNESCAKTPNSDGFNMSEFLKLEQQCKTPKMVVDSPVSRVCNLFENKMILNNQKGELVDEQVTHETLMNEIYRIIKLDEELCKDTANKIKEILEQQIKHEENLKLIASLVSKLHDVNSEKYQQIEKSENKENSFKRRSLRIQNRSSPNNRGAVGSPVILKSGDLRKTALTKSLVHKYHKYQIESPRIRKALDMYNSTKNTCNVLLSPKVTRGQLVATLADTGLRNNLSLKVQQQCLMLQDTPKHK